MTDGQVNGALVAVVAVCGKLFGGRGLSGADSFFDLGGNSLDAVELVAALEEEYSLSLQLADLLESKTLVDIASKCVNVDSSKPH